MCCSQQILIFFITLDNHTHGFYFIFVSDLDDHVTDGFLSDVKCIQMCVILKFDCLRELFSEDKKVVHERPAVYSALSNLFIQQFLFITPYLDNILATILLLQVFVINLEQNWAV